MSAVSASPAAQGSGRGIPADPVRALQHALYRAAKADPGRRFHALYDKVHRGDVLRRAWAAVRRNNGAPGIDKITLGQVEEYGVARLLGELASELREGRYRPLPARRVFIPKPGAPAGEQRPLSIPPVRDRIVQAAVKIVLEPVFEADFLPCSFGFRPGRSQQDASLGLEPKAAKTRIAHLEVGGEGFDFLGFHHRLVRSRGLGGKPRVTFLARWPSDRAMQHARDRIRDLTGRRRLGLWPELIAEDLNRVVLRQGARARRERAGAGRARRRPAVGLRRAAGQHS